MENLYLVEMGGTKLNSSLKIRKSSCLNLFEKYRHLLHLLVGKKSDIYCFSRPAWLHERDTDLDFWDKQSSHLCGHVTLFLLSAEVHSVNIKVK